MGVQKVIYDYTVFRPHALLSLRLLIKIPTRQRLFSQTNLMGRHSPTGECFSSKCKLRACEKSARERRA